MVYQSSIELAEVVLNVADLKQQVEFYRNVLGMHVIKQEENGAELGLTDGTVLLRLEQIAGVRAQVAGLYHVAILLPSRKALGDILYHFLYGKVPLVGASDHGYSEAIYLEDIEGNGIEIYRDLPFETWNIQADGTIIGKTEQMDAQGVLNSTTPPSQASYTMPNGTKIGHVHLSVPQAQTASQWYQKVFSLGDKFSVPSASWIASGNYHHHLAFNEWAGKHIGKRTDTMLGLRYFTVHVTDEQAYQHILQMVQESDVTVIEQTNSSLFLEDRDGIRSLWKLVVSS